MASHRLADVLRATGRLSEKEIANMDEDEGWHWLRANRPVSSKTCENGAAESSAKH